MPDISSFEKIVLTGATGFIGRHLVDALIQAGCQPVLLERSHKENSFLSGLGDQVRVVQADLKNNDQIGSVLSQESPDIIFHLAGTRGRNRISAALECAELNIGATVRLLEAAAHAEVQRIVIVGSADEYGDQSGRLHEELPLRPASLYGISKAAATRFAQAMHNSNGCPVIIVRPFSVYGPGQPRDMFVAEAVDSAVRNVAFSMSNGEQRRDLIFVDDVVRGLIAAACAKNAEGQVVNLGTGQAHRLRDVAERIWEITGTRASLLIGARPSPAEELYDTWADITLARRLFEWEPIVDLESGLERTIQFAREQSVRTQQCQAM